jgi:hypothetical protein
MALYQGKLPKTMTPLNQSHRLAGIASISLNKLRANIDGAVPVPPTKEDEKIKR